MPGDEEIVVRCEVTVEVDPRLAGVAHTVEVVWCKMRAPPARQRIGVFRWPATTIGFTTSPESKVLDGPPEGGLAFVKVKDELIVHRTLSGRQEIKATFLEDDRHVRVLTFQRYNKVSGPADGWRFSFVGSESEALLKFAMSVRSVELKTQGSFRVPDSALDDIILNEVQARDVFAKNEETFLRLAESEELQRDLVAVGFRRKQLERFERLLGDPDFFAAEQSRQGATPEELWQRFFEENTWIFGYGLAYQFLTGLDERKLEQVVRGHDIRGAGKRTDALMKTQARIGSLCFVEIKRHDTLLLGRAYRPGAWAPSAELIGAVAQIQTTVHEALRNLGQRLAPTDREGDPSGEELFSIEPRAFLVVGRLDEFVAEHGVNETKFQAFELYRRNTRPPEILTFDELLHRARFIIEHGQADDAGHGGDDIPL